MNAILTCFKFLWKKRPEKAKLPKALESHNAALNTGPVGRGGGRSIWSCGSYSTDFSFFECYFEV